MMVGVFSLLTPRRIFLAFVVVLIAVGVAGRLRRGRRIAGSVRVVHVRPGRSAVERADHLHVRLERRRDDRQRGLGVRRRRDRQWLRRPALLLRSRRLHGEADGHGRREPHRHAQRGRHRREPQPERRVPLLPRVARRSARRSPSPPTRPTPRTGSTSSAGTSTATANYDATGASATKKFTAGGPHTVTLLVEDQDGGTDTISKTVDVIDPAQPWPRPPAFNFSPADPMVLDNVTFTSTSSDADGSIAVDPVGLRRTTASSTRAARR